MRIDQFTFGSIRIDGVIYEHDVDEVKREAARREVQLLTVPTSEAIRALQAEPTEANAILHVTC